MKTTKRITFKIYKKDYEKIKKSKIPISYFLKQVLDENQKTIKEKIEKTVTVSYYPKKGEVKTYNKENRKHYKDLLREKLKNSSIKL